jgi:hypothetical protein
MPRQLEDLTADRLRWQHDHLHRLDRRTTGDTAWPNLVRMGEELSFRLFEFRVSNFCIPLSLDFSLGLVF